MKTLIVWFAAAAVLFAAETKSVAFPTAGFTIPADDDIKVMQRNCQWCHSYGYILNQGRQSRAFWHKVVVKMREVYKAPISAADEQKATDYLVRHFGPAE